MKSFVTAIVSALVLAFVSAAVMSSLQSGADTRFTTGGARVGDPGHNLIGG